MIPSLPDNSTLVTMDVSSLYTNIDHEEGAQACYEYLEKRKNSTLLKRLILLALQSNVFLFGNVLYHQIKGTAMGTLMAPNYINLFMASLEEKIINQYHQKT